MVMSRKQAKAELMAAVEEFMLLAFCARLAGPELRDEVIRRWPRLTAEEFLTASVHSHELWKQIVGMGASPTELVH